MVILFDEEFWAKQGIVQVQYEFLKLKIHLKI